MTQVLVTGGTGFIGSHLVDALLSGGVKVKCLVRSGRRLRWLKGRDVELTEGDCTVPCTLQAAVADVDVVYHLAGVSWAARESDFFLHNVQGTRNLMEACARYNPGLRRFVLVSSQAAAGPNPSSRPRSESDPPAPVTPYGVSKLEAEQTALTYRERVPLVIVRPCGVYGPRDTGFLAYFRLVRRGFLVEFTRERDREASLCHVHDVVAGLIGAAHSQVASGSVYFLADSEPYPWGEVENMIQEAVGVNARRLKVPGWLLGSLGALGQMYGRVTGKFVTLNKSRIADIRALHWGCDISKARRELDFAPVVNIKDGLVDVIRWYKQEQWL